MQRLQVGSGYLLQWLSTLALGTMSLTKLETHLIGLASQQLPYLSTSRVVACVSAVAQSDFSFYVGASDQTLVPMLTEQVLSNLAFSPILNLT